MPLGLLEAGVHLFELGSRPSNFLNTEMTKSGLGYWEICPEAVGSRAFPSCGNPKQLTSGERYAERVARRANVACKGSSRFSQSPRPATIASDRSSGRFENFSIAAISLN